MATTFSGPLMAGSVRQGANKNLGFVEMVQSVDLVGAEGIDNGQVRPGGATGLIIPAHSRITDIMFHIVSSGSDQTISTVLGPSTSGTRASRELSLANPVSTANRIFSVTGNTYARNLDLWSDTGFEDLEIWRYGNGALASFRASLTIRYILGYHDVRPF